MLCELLPGGILSVAVPLSHMSNEQTDVVDIIGTDRMTGEVILTVSDHLDWSDSTAHQILLQNKLNRYLAFVESGEVLQSYPGSRGKAIVFSVVFKFSPDEYGHKFLERARHVIESAGFALRDSYRLPPPPL